MDAYFQRGRIEATGLDTNAKVTRMEEQLHDLAGGVDFLVGKAKGERFIAKPADVGYKEAIRIERDQNRESTAGSPTGSHSPQLKTK